MRFPAVRGAALLFAFVVASLSLGSCACAATTTPADTKGGHCGAAGSGVRAMVDACNCACMTAGALSASPQLVPASVRPTSLLPAIHALVRSSDHFGPPFPSRRIGHPPPASATSVLRI